MLSNIFDLIGRILISLVFLLSGVNKIINYDATFIWMEDYGVVPEGTNFGIKSNVVINFLESNNINLVDVNTKELSKERLGKTITDGTYYISCLMTMAQIEKMRERKVMFTNLN